MASTAAARGVPPTAGLGCNRRASSSALGAGVAQPAADAGGEVGDVTEHRDLGDGAGVELVAALLEGLDDRVDDEPVLAVVLDRCGQRARATLRRRRRPRFRRRAATRRRRRCGARAARGSRRRARRTRRRSNRAAATRAARTMSRQVEWRVGLDDDLAREHDLLELDRRRSRRARACTMARHCSRDRGSHDGEPGGWRSPGRPRRTSPGSISVTHARPSSSPTTRAGTTSSPAAAGSNGNPPTASAPVPGGASGSSASIAASAAATSSGATRAATPDATMPGLVVQPREPVGVDVRRSRSSPGSTSRVTARRRAGAGVVVMRASP